MEATLRPDELTAALARPSLLADRSLPQWDLLIRLARQSGLLARLHGLLEERGVLGDVPEAPRRHLIGAAILAAKHARDVRWEVRCIKRALAPLGIPIILLKGAAYVMGCLPAAAGRIFSDVDILLPEDVLPEAEAQLRRAGWVAAPLGSDDERYYRVWMHQIPPMTHRRRGTTIDVHHTIVARTTRLHLSAGKLIAAAVAIEGDAMLRMLAPTDMVLHSATHLLNEGGFGHGLRDLDDLDRLLRHFGRDGGFWPALMNRAAELDLRRPLFYALRYTTRLLGTPMPAAGLARARLDPPNLALRRLMDALFARALRPDHPACRDALSGIALAMLYLRAHHLLMPWHILVPHLIRKARMRRKEPE
ncbi:MAG: nucleotidyltransferase family protein [Alphaproteobacteria bacterium]|nr:nucleotidyltransferase family protein [Alphaproteobacteria bacterium]